MPSIRIPPPLHRIFPHPPVLHTTLMLLILAGLKTPAFADIQFRQSPAQLEILVDNQPFAIYVWEDARTTRPYFKSLRAPVAGIQVTRNHPPKPGDFDDHETYHPGLWWGFGDIGGNDYWRMKARVVGGRFVERPTGGDDSGEFAVENQLLVAGSDQVFCKQTCHYAFHKTGHGILLLCTMKLHDVQDDFWLGDQEEMGLAFRVATPLTVEKGGRIVDSEGRTNLKEVRTHQADWCDYSGVSKGMFTGLQLMNAPENFRRPWWHAVKTGLLVANPLGESELNGRGKRKENVRVKANQGFQLRYGVLVHAHDQQSDFNPQAAYREFLEIVLRE